MDQLFGPLDVTYCKRVIKPTEDEVKLHKAFLKNNLRKNYFN